MPLKVGKRGDQYCLIEPDGSVMKGSCHSDRGETLAQLKAIEANKKMEEIVSIQLEEGGPVVLGIAATNRPHLPLPPMSITEVDGKKMVRVPFLRKGVFRNAKYGDLVFDKKTMQKMLENHNAGLSHYGVSLDIRHKPELGALAWFDKEHGGYIKQETDDKYGDLLVAYGEPTTEEAKEIIERNVYNYASVEFHPKWQSPVKKLSMDDFEEVDKEELVSLDEIVENEVIENIKLFNPFHDEKGRFTSKSGSSGSGSSKDYDKDFEYSEKVDEELGAVVNSRNPKRGIRKLVKKHGKQNVRKAIKANMQGIEGESANRDVHKTFLELDKVVKNLQSFYDDATVKLFNPFHDKLGRFTSKSGGTGGSKGSSGKSGKSKSNSGKSLKTKGFSKGQKAGKIALGALAGAISGAAIGGASALVFNAIDSSGAMGVPSSPKERSTFFNSMVVIGSVSGAVGGALDASRTLEDSTISLETDMRSNIRKFISGLRAFLDRDEKLFGIKKSIGSEKLLKIGFEEKEGYYTIDKDSARKLVSRLEKGINKKLEVSMEVREDGTGVLTAEEVEQVKAMQQKLNDASDKIVTLEEQVVNLNEQLEETQVEDEDDDQDEIPEKTRVQLEQHQKEIRRLRREALQTQVDLVLARAQNYRDEDGKGHSKVLLETIEKAMLGKAIGEDETVKLEENTPSGIADYFRKALVYILEHVPGQVQFETKTEADEEVTLENGNTDNIDFTTWWGETEEES